jgi:hypothetical protein
VQRRPFEVEGRLFGHGRQVWRSCRAPLTFPAFTPRHEIYIFGSTLWVFFTTIHYEIRREGSTIRLD